MAQALLIGYLRVNPLTGGPNPRCRAPDNNRSRWSL